MLGPCTQPESEPFLALAESYSALCGAPESVQAGARLAPSVPDSKPASTSVAGAAKSPFGQYAEAEQEGQ